MNNSSLRDKYFDLWSNLLSPEEAKKLHEQIAADPVLQQQYAEDVMLFESLRELQSESIAIPSDFAESVREKVLKRNFIQVLWRKVMKKVQAIGWMMILGVLLPAVVMLGLIILNISPEEVNAPWFESIMNVSLNTASGPIGVLILFALLLLGLASIPMKAFRMGSGAVLAMVALITFRTSSSTLHQTSQISHINSPLEARDDVVSSVSKNQPAPGLQGELSDHELNTTGTSQLLQKRAEEMKQGSVDASAPSAKSKDAFSNGRSGPVMAPAQAGGAQNGVAVGFAMPERDRMIQPFQENREGYGQYDENPRISVQSNSVSTFSIDVDTGSYSNIRRFLRLGQLPPKDAVRIEELINYFPYHYEAQGDKPFSVQYEIAPSPLSKGRYLLKVGLKAQKAKIDDSKGWNLVFLVDTSGSMEEPNKLPLVKQSLKLLTDKMRKEDKIALVTYAGSAGVVLPSTSGSEKNKIIAAIDSLNSGGSTNGASGIELAYQQAEANKIAGSVNRVILATDGDFNVGISDFNGLMNLIEKKRELGVTLTTLGFGTGNYQEKNMEQLADKGNGNYFYIDSFQEAKKVLSTELTQAMEVVAKDVKLQIEFNPAQVKEFRLVGFDNRILQKEDFVNDKIDAGEVGSGHTVTALYEIELTSHPVANSVSQPLRYQPTAAIPTPTSLEGELGFLKIRAKASEGRSSEEYSYPVSSSLIKNSIESTSDDFRFAAAVAGFGMLLRESKYLGEFSWSDIHSLAANARGEDPFGYRNEFLSLIDAASTIRPAPTISNPCGNGNIHLDSEEFRTPCDNLVGGQVPVLR